MPLPPSQPKSNFVPICTIAISQKSHLLRRIVSASSLAGTFALKLRAKNKPEHLPLDSRGFGHG